MTKLPNDGLQMTDYDYSDLHYSDARNRTTKAAIPNKRITVKTKSWCYNGKCHMTNVNCYEEGAECYLNDYIPDLYPTRKVKSWCYNGKCTGSNDNCYEEFADCYYSEFRKNLRKSSRKSRKI